MAKLHVRALSLVVFFLLVEVAQAETNAVKGMDLLSRSKIVALIQGDRPLCEAIQTAARHFHQFESSFRSKSRAQDQFMVTVVAKQGEQLIPIGILVDEVTEEVLSGYVVSNALPLRRADRFSCTVAQIVDWRYRDAFELVGGVVYQLLLTRCKESVARTIVEEAPFFLRKGRELPRSGLALLLDIANGRNDSLEAALRSHHELTRGEFIAPIENKVGARTFIAESRVTLAEYVCRFGDADAIQITFEAGLLTEKKDQYSPLVFSCDTGNITTAEQLIRLGFDLDTHDGETGLAPLHIAVSAGHSELVKLFIRHGADPDITTYGGETAIFYASAEEILNSLIASGCDLNHADNDGCTALDRAVEDGRATAASVLAQHGASLSGRRIHTEMQTAPREAAAQIKEILAGNADATEEFELVTSIAYGAVLPVKSLGSIRD